MTCTGECIYFAARRHQEICYSLALPSFSHCSTSLGPYFIPAPPIPKQIYLQALFPYIHTPFQHMHTYCCGHVYSCICAINSRHVQAAEDHKHTFAWNQMYEHTMTHICFLPCAALLLMRIFNDITILPFCLGLQSLHDGVIIALIYSAKTKGFFFNLRRKQTTK